MIFNLFKSKPTLSELIPNGFVDIHSHILPGIDDGAKNIEESLELISRMKKVGFKKIICTPHIHQQLYDNNIKTIKESFNSIENKYDNNINVGYAAEYMIDHTLMEKIENKSLLCIKDKYVLIEMSYIAESPNIHQIIFNLIMGGYIPIIAHPERYLYYQNDIKKFYKLKKWGCMFQLNLLSTIGYYGKEVLNIANLLLSKKLIDFVGSDIHNHRHINAFGKKIKIKEVDVLAEAIESNQLFK